MQQYKPGDSIGGEYAVLEVFGGEDRSGMGVVYLVENREYPKPIVLKTSQQTVGEDARRRFVSEAQAWVRAGIHANIVKAHWVREIAEQLFVAADYVAPDEEGRNNLTHFLRTGQLRVEIILLWATQFCHGMNYAKARGVLAHRDIKPDNLMIEESITLKITDFGLAKSIDVESQPQQRGWWVFGRKHSPKTLAGTMTGSAMGTLPYMAPEQFVDAKSVDHRADIYGFGIILYQMVAGNEYPYRIRSDASDVALQFFKAHIEESPSPLKSPLMPIIGRCLEKEPARRYATYDEFLNDLSAVATRLRIKLPKLVHVAQEDEELYAQAQSYVALGDKDRALKAIDEYVFKYPEYACGWTEKGKIHFQREEYAQGLTATQQSLEINPYNTHAWNNLGIGLRNTGAPIGEIKTAYGTAIHFDPQNTAAMMNLVGPLVLQKEYAQAVELTTRALKICPDKLLALQKAEVLLQNLLDDKLFAMAEKLLSGWTDARPSDATGWHNFGLMCLDKADNDRAIQCFTRVYELDPQDTFAVLQLAKLYFHKKSARECLEYCNILLQRGHEMNLAVSLKARVVNFVLGYERALEFLQPYLDHNLENDVLWVVLAEIHEYRDQYELAIIALQTAKRILEHQSGEHCEENLRFVEEKLRQLE